MQPQNRDNWAKAYSGLFRQVLSPSAVREMQEEIEIALTSENRKPPFAGEIAEAVRSLAAEWSSDYPPTAANILASLRENRRAYARARSADGCALCLGTGWRSYRECYASHADAEYVYGGVPLRIARDGAPSMNSSVPCLCTLGNVFSDQWIGKIPLRTFHDMIGFPNNGSSVPPPAAGGG